MDVEVLFVKKVFTGILSAFVTIALIFSVMTVAPQTYEATGTIKIKSITLNKKSATILFGKTLQLIATIKPANASNKQLTWKSSNTRVATVSNTGLVSTVAGGTATITVKANDGSRKNATCRITVKQYVGKVTLNTHTVNLTKRGKTYRLKATVLPTTASNRKVKWSSNNTRIATVSSSGTVTAKGTGTCTITCTAADGSGKSDKCTVRVGTVPPAPVIRSIDPSSFKAKDDWVYIEGKLPDSTHALIKMHADGTEKKVINSDHISEFTISDNWIYYVPYNEGGWPSNKIFRMLSDGSQKAQIVAVGEKQQINDLFVYNNMIYYQTHDTTNYAFKPYKIFKRNIDGTKETLIIESQPILHIMAVYNNRIYYTNMQEHQAELNSCNTDGQDHQEVSDRYTENIYTVIPDNEGVYYDAEATTINHTPKICRNNTTIFSNSNDAYNGYIKLIGIQGDWIYYENESLYRVKKDGSGNERVIKETYDFYMISNGWIFYGKDPPNQIHFEKDIWRVRIDGTGAQEIL